MGWDTHIQLQHRSQALCHRRDNERDEYNDKGDWDRVFVMVLCLLTGIQLLVIIDGLVVLPAVQLRLHNLRETRGESIQYPLMTLSSLYLTGDEALERVGQQDGEGEHDATEIHQIIVPAVVLQQVPWNVSAGSKSPQLRDINLQRNALRTLGQSPECRVSGDSKQSGDSPGESQ